MHKYVLVDSKEKGFESEDDWNRFCTRKKIPFIKIKRHKRFSDVHWDYITFPAEYDKILDENDQKIRHRAHEILSLHANDNLDCQISCNTITFYNLDHDQAVYAAEELFDFLYKLTNSSQNVKPNIR